MLNPLNYLRKADHIVEKQEVKFFEQFKQENY
jgi:hypothetical protein